KWNRMSPFGEERIAAQDLDEEPLQVASPMAEAAPPRRIDESHQSVKISVADAVASQPEAQQTRKTAPTEPPTTTRSPEPVPIAVFDPMPASTLGRRGLAIPDPDDDPRIKAPFSDYGADEHSSLKRFALPAIILVLLAAGAFAGTRTEAGRVWLQRAVDSVRDAYNSATGQKNETAAPTVEPPPPVTQTPAGEVAASSTPTASPSNSTSPSASQQPAQPSQNLPPTAAEDKRPSGTPEDISRQRASQQMIGANVLRVPASTMAANLITSRVPAYPESARAQDIEGAVIMDVVISQAGTVKYVRVIDGDRHLRAAAQDAVLRWRYKPYLLNGEAVEVATTVKLDFRLPE
ncbi:MAG TPA: TonB family protein, partial [Edaphobacter sp.]